MAKAEWCKVSPSSGNDGTTDVNISADPHTGTAQRQTTVTFSALGSAGSASCALTVSQEGKPEFVSFKDTEDVNIPYVSLSRFFTILSNAGKLTLSIKFRNGESGGIFAPYPGLAANNVNPLVRADNNETHEVTMSSDGAGTTFFNCGDVGDSTEYELSFSIPFPQNTASVVRQWQLTLSGESDSANAVLTVTQAAGNASISVEPESVEVQTDGASETVQVQSNAGWSAS